MQVLHSALQASQTLVVGLPYFPAGQLAAATQEDVVVVSLYVLTAHWSQVLVPALGTLVLGHEATHSLVSGFLYLPPEQVVPQEPLSKKCRALVQLRQVVLAAPEHVAQAGSQL